MVTGGDRNGLIFNYFLEGFDTCSSWFFVVVVTSDMSYGLTWRSTKMSTGFISFCGIDVGTWAWTS